MGLLTNWAVGALMQETHPTIDRRQCWNLRPHKERCEDCMQVCPKGLFSRPGFIRDFKGCLDCGLCVSVCRTRCIAPSPEQVERDVKPAESDAERVWIGCERSQRQNDVVRDCVAALAWENLAYLALTKKLVIDLTPCADCTQAACQARVQAELKRLVEFMGEPLFATRVTLARQPEDAPYTPKAYTREEMMKHMTEGSKSGTKQLLRRLPVLRDEDSQGHAMDHRMMLNQRLKQIKQNSPRPPKFGWYLPVINNKCYGCERCVRACRAGALQLVDGEDGLTRVVVTAWKCSECGQCTSVCTEKAMEGMALRQVQTLGPISVHKFQKMLCPECGKPMQPDCPDGICRLCASKKRLQARREQAAQRAKERAEAREKEKARKAAEQAAQAAQTAETETAGVAAPAQPPAPAEAQA